MSINVVVLGAAGRTGRLIVAEAQRSGHHVTAAVRNPASIPAVPGLRVERADVRDAESLRAVIEGHDAVVSAVKRATSTPTAPAPSCRRCRPPR